MRNVWFKRLGCIVFLILLCGISILVYLNKTPANPKFIFKRISFDAKEKFLREAPFFESQLIPQPKFLLSSHSSTFEVLPNGHLLALWFAGSHEGKPDVKIWQSEFDPATNVWTMAKPIVSPASLSRDTNSYIKKVGNPLLYRSLNGDLHLFVVSVTIGGWSGSSLNHLISKDNGQNWMPAQKLLLSPFFNLSTLARTRPVTLVDGGFYVPVYHELINKYPELIQFDANGNFIRQIRISSQNYMLQPAVVALSSTNAAVFLRNGAYTDNILYMQTTNDGGVNWSMPKATNLHNHDSSLVVIPIWGNKLLMVHNNIEQRTHLMLSISDDGGYNWKNIAYLENTEGKEFSYPSIQIHNGIIDVLYTWNRQLIKHVRFNLAWLVQQERTINAESISIH